jgi:hypothetical protein
MENEELIKETFAPGEGFSRSARNALRCRHASYRALHRKGFSVGLAERPFLIHSKAKKCLWHKK